jgi:hypothetical protein
MGGGTMLQSTGEGMGLDFDGLPLLVVFLESLGFVVRSDGWNHLLGVQSDLAV